MAEMEFGEQVGLIARKQNMQDTKLTDHAPDNSRHIIQDGTLTFYVTSHRIIDQSYNNFFVFDHPTRGRPDTSGGYLGDFTAGTQSNQSSGQSVKLTNDGKREIAYWLANQAAQYPTYIALGTNGTAPSETDSSLFGEIERHGIDEVTVTDKIITFRCKRPGITNSGQQVRELGIFNSSSAGDCFVRITISAWTLNTTGQSFVYIDLSGSNQTPVMDGAITGTFNWLSGGGNGSPTHIAWGTGSTYITSSTWSAMESEELRNTVSSRTGPIEAKGYQVRWEAQMGVTEGTGNVFRQSALFDAATGGNMWLYGNNPPMDKTDRYSIDTDFGLRQG